MVMRTGPTPGKTFPLSKSEMYIGRDATNDVIINDAEISRKHSRLVMVPGGYMIEDLGSTNGTFVNGQRLMGPHTLRPGELVMLGENISLAFEAAQFDPDATIVGAGPIATPISTPEMPAFEPATPLPVSHSVTPPPSGGPLPSGPAVYEEPLTPPKKGSGRIWILAGCGCLFLLCLAVVGIGFAFDAMDLYCTPPFNAVFPCP